MDGHITADEISQIATQCLICGEPVPIFSPRDVPKVCPACKKAILSIREKMEKEE